MPPVSVCHQVSITGTPNVRWHHCTASASSGSPTLATSRRCDRSASRGQFVACPLQHADRRRRGVEHVDGVAFEDLIPALGVELGFVDDRGHAVGERGDDAVRRTGHPARVGGAPERVALVQVEHEAAGGVVGHHRRVDVDGSLRLARRPAREVHQRGCLGIGRVGLERVAALGEEGPERHHLGPLCPIPPRAEFVLGAPAHQDEFEVWQAIEDRRNFAAVQQGCRDEDSDPADVHPLGDRVGSERGEQRCEGPVGLERAERRHVQVGDAPGQAGDTGARPEVPAAHRIGEPVRPPGQPGIGDVDGIVDVARIATDEPERHPVTAALPDVSIDGEVGDVDAVGPTGPTIRAQRGPRIVPVERRHGRGVVDEPRVRVVRHHHRASIDRCGGDRGQGQQVVTVGR